MRRTAFGFPLLVLQNSSLRRSSEKVAVATETPFAASATTAAASSKPAVKPASKKATLSLKEHRLNKWKAPTDEGDLRIRKEYNKFKHFMHISRDFSKEICLPVCCLAAYIGLPIAGFDSWSVFGASAVSMAALNRLTVVRGARNSIKKDLTGKSALVLGTSVLACEIARQLYQMGASVRVVGAASQREAVSKRLGEMMDEKAKGKLEFIELDLSDPHQIRSVAAQFKSNVSSLDYIATCCYDSYPELEYSKVTGEEMNLQMNFLGPYYFLDKILPLLQAGKGRIVFGTTRNHGTVINQAVMRELLNTKFAPEDHLGFKQFGAAHVGMLYYMNTLTGAKAGGISVAAADCGTVAAGEVTPESKPLTMFQRLMAKNGEEASQTFVNALLRDDLVNGGYYADCKLRPNARSKTSMDDALAQETLNWAANRSIKKY